MEMKISSGSGTTLLWFVLSESQSQFVPRDIFEWIPSEYTIDRQITIFIEVNKDILNIFEVEESTFNGDKVKFLYAHERNFWHTTQQFLKHSSVYINLFLIGGE